MDKNLPNCTSEIITGTKLTLMRIIFCKCKCNLKKL